MSYQGKWIRPLKDLGDVAPVFKKKWKEEGKVVKAELLLTSLGVYEAFLNGQRVSDYVLAPGWTVYEKRLQYQTYDVTELLEDDNKLEVTVGKGWFRSEMPGGWQEFPDKETRMKRSCGLFGELTLIMEDGSKKVISTDDSWQYTGSAVIYSEIYHGETYDARITPQDWQPVAEFDWSTDILIPQEGDEIREMERIAAREIIKTPKGETVLDFGQLLTGYVEFTLEARAGDEIRIQCGEVLDAQGNFYNENYRTARSEIVYICKDGVQTWKPKLTFFGFRYLKLEEFPGIPTPEQFTGIAVYSDMKRIGRIETSNHKLNQLFSNIIWGQVGNFLDVPTDCPQRDERLGWTGDAQVFVKTASYNFDVERFFIKWLKDLSAEQFENGGVPNVIPDYLGDGGVSAAWGDAATICPWQIYLTYGNKEILENQFDSMVGWVNYITNATKDEYLWTGGEHFGDWVGLDAPVGSYKGSSREDFIASAFYAYSTELLIKSGKVLGRDVGRYEELYDKIVEAFRAHFTSYKTQTEYALAIQFGLAPDLQKTADELAKKVIADGKMLQTGFVGTPYLLHVLSKYGHTELAYSLLLREEYPSWLYPVNKGATTMWEHWDGIMEDGSFWSADMNSFNHYAYGAVADWIYEEAAGIQVVEEKPGFEMIVFAPKPDKRLEFLAASIDTRYGMVRSRWSRVDEKWRIEIDTPVTAEVVIDGVVSRVEAGSYIFWCD
jgi:alpha-L-rhamnosidase